METSIQFTTTGNTIVPASLMLKKKDLRSLNKWHRLNTNSWIYDFGLIQKWNDETGHGNYFVTDKSHKPGWDFLLYAGAEDVKIFLAHYHLPQDTREFLKWTYNNVAADSDWKTSHEKQGEFFPYKLLYDGWKAMTTKKIVEQSFDSKSLAAFNDSVTKNFQ